MKEIKSIPELPFSIVEALNEKKLALFIGAGVSRIMGCCGWEEISKKLLGICKSTGIISFREFKNLQDRSPKELITICRHLLESNGNDDKFYELIASCLELDKNLGFNLYKELTSLSGKFQGPIITTNIDNHFHEFFEDKNIFYDVEGSDVERLLQHLGSRSLLCHVHGCLEKDKKGIVFTLREYIHRYNNKHFKKVLEHIFNEYRVLFIGYGLEEFEILDFIITKYGDQIKHDSEGRCKHFILKPYFRGDERLLEYDQHYYRDLGIEVIPYAIDERGYSQLHEVLEEWNIQINNKSRYIVDFINKIDDTIENYDKEKALEVFQTIKTDSSLKKIFLEKLQLNPVPWFSLLHERKFFSFEGKSMRYIRLTLGYLKSLALKMKNENLMSNSNEFEDFKNVLDNIIKFDETHGGLSKDTTCQFLLVGIILSLPAEEISEKHVKLIKAIFKEKGSEVVFSKEIVDELTRSIEEKEKKGLNNWISVVYGFKIEEYKKKFINFTEYTVKPLVDVEYLKKIRKGYRNSLFKLYCPELIFELKVIMDRIIDSVDNQFNFGQISTIEDHPQGKYNDEYLSELVYLIRDAMIFEVSENKNFEIVESFLKEKHSIFKRIGLHIIDKFYDDLKKLFWSLDENPLDDFSLYHEVYELLKNNSSKFSKEELDKVIDWIETCYFDPEITEEDIAYSKKKWLYALDTKNERINELYEKYDSIAPGKIEHPGFLIWIGGLKGPDGPIPLSTFLTKSNKELVELLNNFSTNSKFDQFVVESVFIKAVSDNPQKFIKEINPFFELQEPFLSDFFQGLVKASELEKRFNWNSLLRFIGNLLKRRGFVEDHVASSIADILLEYIKKDLEDLENVKELFNLLLNMLPYKTRSKKLVRDIDIIGSPLYKVFSGLINYSLKEYKRSSRWDPEVKDIIEDNLENHGLEIYYAVGTYLPQLYLIDDVWTTKNLNRIFPKDNEENWKASFSAYLKYPSHVPPSLLKLILSNGHYKQALETKFEEEGIFSLIVRDIALSFYENFDESVELILCLIQKRDPKQLRYFIRSFKWFAKEYKNKDFVKIKELWGQLYSCLLEKENEEIFQELFSELASWLSIFDSIDNQIFEWLKKSVKYLTEADSYIFIEELSKHAEKNPREVAELHICMLKEGKYVEIAQDHIRKIVDTLYEKGGDYKGYANTICNMYLSEGFEFLKDTFEKNNPSNFLDF
ncbi:SIR2 family protein [Methanothermobacter sp.]|uniref:SIR2 family NAD-dependent protein deacylase n=1 Tax=Methanothermobacter sp. TaxID=1884223 RepID=UPI00262AFAD4|nr:SIR2 family protein [Methanothermobacter sp.]MDI9615131.1 SIR2 family protein [Methanothermobacter sp.]